MIITCPLESQSLLNRVKKAVSKEISGDTGEDNSNNSSKPRPEPLCACEKAKLIFDLSGKLNLDYDEISVSINNDGSILVKDKNSGKYYIVKDGVTQGPYEADDPHVSKFRSSDEDSNSSKEKDDWVSKFPDYISRSGEKYIIKFNGKNFGTFGLISDFAVARTRDKFAAVVTENLLFTEEQSKQMEAEIKNAKTDQEKMDLSMKYSQQVNQQLMQGGGVTSIQPKLISNVPGAVYDPMKWAGGSLNGQIKFDDIVVLAPDKIIDLQGNAVLKLNESSINYKNIFVNSSNSKYATYNYGTLTFSDNTTLSDLFYPYLVKTEGKVYLTYMYYSPGKNSIMQCSIPF
jgi:hypothetical protein